MSNITIVGLDYENVKIFANKLAEKMNYQYIDAVQVFDLYLVKSAQLPLQFADELLQKKEAEILKNLSVKNDVIISISADMFLSNQNYLILNNNCKILINKENLNNIDKNIEKLIKNHCNFEFNQKNLNYLDIINKIRG